MKTGVSLRIDVDILLRESERKAARTSDPDRPAPRTPAGSICHFWQTSRAGSGRPAMYSSRVAALIWINQTLYALWHPTRSPSATYPPPRDLTCHLPPLRWPLGPVQQVPR